MADDEVVGDIVSWLDSGGREVGYWIGREHWGKGFATAALRLVLEEIEDRPITAQIVPHNIGSQRVVEKCGFVRVGEEVAEDGIHELIFRLD